MQALKRLFADAQHDQPFLLNEALFARALRAERRRVDRNQSRLAMVKFLSSGQSGWRSVPAALSQALCERLRETDVAGLLASNQVGVLLPDTDAAGATHFADAIRLRCKSELDLVAEVYTYPDISLPASGASARDFDLPDLQPPRGKSLEPLLVDPLPAWKRCLDVTVASAALVTLTPVLLLTALAVKCSSPGPVLFRQWRGGRGGEPFLLYKFRTMCVDAEARKADLIARNEQDGPAFKIKQDPRITRVGRYLRRTSLDELPQLWNVIWGDMTLVGPRPLPCAETNECRGWQRRRLEVTPGLTCIWQVDGGVGVSFAEWMRMDIRYIHSRRIARDLNLLWRTALKVLMLRASH